MNICGKFVVAVAAGLFLTACGGGTLEADLEAVFPADAGAVFVFDYSDEAQIEKFRALKDQFPEIGLWEELLEDAAGEDNRKRVKNFRKVLGGTWKLGASIKASESDDEELYTFYVAGKFSEPGAAQKLIDAWMEDDGVDFEYSRDGDVRFWTNVEKSLYLVRELDLFFLTNSEVARDEALARIDANDGFNMNEYANGENLGYMYVGFGEMKTVFGNFYEELGMVEVASYFDVLGDMYGQWFADDGGIRLVSGASVVEGGDFDELFGNVSYKLSLVDQVSADGLFFYSEQNNFRPLFDSFVQSLSSSFGAGSVLDGGEVEDALIFPEDLPVNDGALRSMEFLKSFGGLSDEEVIAIMESPFAMTLSDAGEILPGMALYLSLDEGEVEAAKKMVSGFDDYITAILNGLGGQLAALGADDVNVDELFFNEIELVNGGAFHKLSLNMDALPEQFIYGFSQGFGADVSGISLELWYGVTGGNVMAVAFEPDFGKRYGQNVLSADESYKEAVSEVAGTYGYVVNYMRMQPVLDILNRYAEIFKWERTEKMQLYMDEFFPLFKYFVASGAFEESGDGGLRMVSDGYFRIGR